MLNQADSSHCRKEVSAMPRDIQENSRSHNKSGYIHPDRSSRVRNMIHDISDLPLGSSLPDKHSQFIKPTEPFVLKFRTDRIQLKTKIDPLSCTRSGKIIAILLSNKQRNYLQSIHKDTIPTYLGNRKLSLPP